MWEHVSIPAIHWLQNITIRFKVIMINNLTPFQNSFLYFVGVFNQTNIPFAFVRYEVSIANKAYSTSLATYHLISTDNMYNYDSNQESSFCTINLYMRIYCNTCTSLTSKHNNNNFFIYYVP